MNLKTEIGKPHTKVWGIIINDNSPHFSVGCSAPVIRLIVGIYNLGLGLATTFKHLFKPAITLQYPDEKRQPYPAFRGNLRLNRDKCISCQICVNYCPNYCISLKFEVGEDKKRKLQNYTVDMGLCMYCDICVEVCPFTALYWDQDYERSVYDRKQLIERKDA